MRSYSNWKKDDARQRMYENHEGDNDVAEIKAIFDDLRKTVRRSSMNAGVLGTMKRGLFGAVRGIGKAVFGKDSKMAQAVPDVSHNHDLHQASTLGTLGRSALGAGMDAYDHIQKELERKREIERRRRERGVHLAHAENEGELYQEWDKDALEVILAKIDDAEQKVVEKIASMKPDTSGVKQTGPNSWETDVPRGHDFSFDSGLPQSGLSFQMQTELPPATFRKIEKKFQTDPRLKTLLAMSKGAAGIGKLLDGLAHQHKTKPEVMLDQLEADYPGIKGVLDPKGKLTKGVRDKLSAFGREEEVEEEKVPTGFSFTSHDKF
jgi:hypothetical protein